MKLIAITGATGLVGSRIIELLQDKYTFIPVSHTELDITKEQDVADFVDKTDFDILLHLAAYTNVDGAEEEYETAEEINVSATKFLYQAVEKKNKQFILFSTDFVFDGIEPPFYEESVPNPISAYGKTKYMAEEVVKEKGMIIRIAYPYRAEFEKKKDFVRTIKYLLEQGKELKMVTDSAMTPTFIDDIAYSLDHLIENFSAEVYHVVGSSSLSPFEAGKAIAKTFGLDEELITGTTYEEFFAGKAQRPQYSKILSSKSTAKDMHSFEEGLTIIKKQMNSNQA